MQVHVNGEAREIPDGLTVHGLLLTMQIDGQQVAVELNAQVVRRVNHAATSLQPGDQVEIVTFVGGG